MKSRLALLSLFFFAIAASTHAQQCPGYNPNMYQDSETTSPTNPPNPCPTTSILNPATRLFSQTNSTTDHCTAPGGGGLTYSSIVTGYGVAHCTPVSVYCSPFFQLGVTAATSPNDYNRFYNRAYDESYTSSGCVRSSAVSRQDFWQCNWITCPSIPSGGGCPRIETCTDGLAWNPVDCACEPASPIIVDVSGKGFVLTNAANGVKFNISGSNTPIQMGWTALGADNAFLALPSVDGLVHNGQQLFGNFTPQPQSAAPNGFAALAVYDLPANGGNLDGVIDSRDAIFSSLRLWIDSNHDGISQPNELFTLPSLGVNSISLSYKADERTDQWGNVFHYRAQVNPGDPTSTGRIAYDVFFVADPSIAKNIIPGAGGKCEVRASKTGMLAPVMLPANLDSQGLVF